MSFSRRGLIAAGLAIASVGVIGVTSTLDAGAATIATTTNDAPASAPDTTTDATTASDSAASGGSPTDGATADAATTTGAATTGDSAGGAAPPASDATPPASDATPPPDLPGSGPAQIAPGSRIGGPRPEGQPLPLLPRRAPKGNPLDDGTPGARAAARRLRAVPPRPPALTTAAPTTIVPNPTVNFMYSSASQQADSDGAYGYFTVAKPALSLTDFHSLAEVTAQSTDGQQVVEVGWTVDRTVNLDAEPHLFVYHWVDNHESCYNACGFVQYSPNVRPGSALPVDVVKRFSIQHFGDAWWVGYDTEWVGYFPDSLWTGHFTRSGLSQWFGEVAALLPTSCSEMGNGKLASDPTAAAVTKIGFYNGPVQGIATGATSPYYTVQQVSTKAFRFGGGGAC